LKSEGPEVQRAVAVELHALGNDKEFWIFAYRFGGRKCFSAVYGTRNHHFEDEIGRFEKFKVSNIDLKLIRYD